MQSLAKQNPHGQVSTTDTPSLIASVVTSLARWNPSETLPEGLSSTRLLEAIAAQREQLRPATNAEVAAICKVLLRHAEAGGIKAPDTTSLHATWVTNCRDMPAILFASGVVEVLKNWTNRFGLPQAGDIWKAIELPLARMRRDLAAMERAYAMTLGDSPDAPDRAPTAETDRILAETLAILTSHSRGVRIR